MKITVINTGAPELTRLAIALNQHGELANLVRPFANQPRAWNAYVSRVPVLKDFYRSTLGRRGISDPGVLEKVTEAGVLADISAAIIRRSKFMPKTSARLDFLLHEIMRRNIQHAASTKARGSTHIIANVGTALLPFRTTLNSSQCKILHFPSAHPRYFAKVWLEEAKRDPRFSEMAPNFGQLSEEILSEYDEEIELSDSIIVGSKFVANSFFEQGIAKEKIKIIPYGVDLGLFRPCEDEHVAEQFTVLFVGRIDQKKGISYLLEGFKKFSRPGAKLRLIGQITGSAKPLESYQGLYEHSLNLTHRELALEMRNASVLVLPSLLEGLPLSVMEAMASGLPVITTACGADDLIRDGVDGHIVQMRDADAIAERLVFLFENREMARAMGTNGAQRIQQFSWAKFCELYREFLMGYEK
jgi:glycosyltransferase involved in cell wall biosynthesis